jgi:hypothetical protein
MNMNEMPIADGTLRQVRRLSRPFLILLSIALGLIVLVQIPEIVALLFFFHGDGTWRAAVSSSASGINLSIFASPDLSPDVMLESLSFGQRSALALLAVLCTISGGVAIFHLRQLFALYCRGEVFTEDNIRHIKRFGLWLVVAAIVVNGAGRVFFVVTGQHSHGTANGAMALIYGGMTWVVARVMELGRQADEERKGFI